MLSKNSPGPKPGELTVKRAAEVLGVSKATVYRWAESRLSAEKSPLEYVRRDPSRRLYLSVSDVRRIQSETTTVVGNLSVDSF